MRISNSIRDLIDAVRTTPPDEVDPRYSNVISLDMNPPWTPEPPDALKPAWRIAKTLVRDLERNAERIARIESKREADNQEADRQMRRELHERQALEHELHQEQSRINVMLAEVGVGLIDDTAPETTPSVVLPTGSDVRLPPAAPPETANEALMRVAAVAAAPPPLADTAGST